MFRCISESHSRLERDSAGWNLNEEEIQRRRIIFWEYFNWECWTVSAMQCVELQFLQTQVLQCVIHGRPPTLNIAHSDCRFPRDLDPYQLPSGNSELGCKQLLLGPAFFFGF